MGFVQGDYPAREMEICSLIVPVTCGGYFPQDVHFVGASVAVIISTFRTGATELE